VTSLLYLVDRLLHWLGYHDTRLCDVYDRRALDEVLS